jgi:hypothetical protein
MLSQIVYALSVSNRSGGWPTGNRNASDIVRPRPGQGGQCSAFDRFRYEEQILSADHCRLDAAERTLV